MVEPYIVLKNFAGTEFKFGIFDEVGKAWYDTPPSPRVGSSSPSPMKAERNLSSGWREMDILRERIALPGSVVVDCGCHHGLTTILLSAWVGAKGFVHAFDAVLENAYYAKQNLALNKVTNVAVHCAGISGSFGFAGMHNDSNVILDHASRWTDKTTMTVRPSALFEAIPDALKMDIEGFELDVIRSDPDFFRSIDRIAIEIHSDYMPPGAPNQIAEILGRSINVLRPDDTLEEFSAEKTYNERCHFFVW